MKKILLLCIPAVWVFSLSVAQTTAVLTFTATFNGVYHPLDSILIENISQGGDTTLYYNDTVLVLQHFSSIHDHGSTHQGMYLSAPFPNPFTDAANVSLFLTADEMVLLRLFDLQGRELATFSQRLEAGDHHFLLHPGDNNLLFMSAGTAGGQQLRKLVHQGTGAAGRCRIEYHGRVNSAPSMRKGIASIPWLPGDNLRYTGFITTGMIYSETDTIHDNPLQSAQYHFQFNSASALAQFTASDTIIVVNDTVHFTDLSAGNPTSWLWHFGDGDSSFQQNPWHVYTQPGFYTVSLKISNPVGTDSLGKYHYIVVGTGLPNACPLMPIAMDTTSNLYNTVQIGTQCWMRENLKTTKYNDGSTILNIITYSQWPLTSTGAYSWYNNSYAVHGIEYGALYNWHAVETGKLCPAGWHVPSNAEWSVLSAFLGGDSVAGGPLKATTHWNAPNAGATNSTWFTALPGGYRDYSDGMFYFVQIFGGWWTSSELMPNAIYRATSSMYPNLLQNAFSKRYGLSVRCIQD